MNDFIIVKGRLGISTAILHLVDEFDVDWFGYEILGQVVTLVWGSDIDDCPIDEEFRYRWAKLGDTPLSQVQAEVNQLRAAIAQARQKYVSEFRNEVISI